MFPKMLSVKTHFFSTNKWFLHYTEGPWMLPKYEALYQFLSVFNVKLW